MKPYLCGCEWFLEAHSQPSGHPCTGPTPGVRRLKGRSGSLHHRSQNHSPCMFSKSGCYRLFPFWKKAFQCLKNFCLETTGFTQRRMRSNLGAKFWYLLTRNYRYGFFLLLSIFAFEFLVVKFKNWDNYFWRYLPI